MKKILIFIFITISTIIYAENYQLDEPILITTQNWEPYNYKTSHNNIKGIATDIIKEVLDTMDIKYVIEVYPWKRSQAMVRDGLADAFYVASQNKIRDKYAVISDTVIDQNWVWYLKINSTFNPKDTDFKDNAIVTALLGSNMLYTLESNKYKIASKPTTMEQLVKLFIGDRVDAVLVNDFVMKEYLKKYNIKNYKNYKKILYKKKPMGIYFSKKFLEKYPWFLDKFNHCLNDCLSKKNKLYRSDF